MRELCLRFKPHTLNIDERKLIQYGLVRSFIRRIHQYPVLLSDKPGQDQDSELLRMCDGSHSVDEIACKLNESRLLDKLEDMSDVTIIYK